MTQHRLIAAPPAHLSARSQELWRAVIRHPMSAGRVLLVEIALQEFDRANELRQVIASEGAISKAKKGKMAHAHPLTGVERQSRATFLKLWMELNLHWDGAIDSKVYSD